MMAASRRGLCCSSRFARGHRRDNTANGNWSFWRTFIGSRQPKLSSNGGASMASSIAFPIQRRSLRPSRAVFSGHGDGRRNGGWRQYRHHRAQASWRNSCARWSPNSIIASRTLWRGSAVISRTQDTARQAASSPRYTAASNPWCNASAFELPSVDGIPLSELVHRELTPTPPK